VSVATSLAALVVVIATATGAPADPSPAPTSVLTPTPTPSYVERVVAHFPGGREDFFTPSSAVIVGNNICRGLRAAAAGTATTDYARLTELLIDQAEVTTADATWLLDITIAEVCDDQRP
jgi:hypothetical protein